MADLRYFSVAVVVACILVILCTLAGLLSWAKFYYMRYRKQGVKQSKGALTSAVSTLSTTSDYSQSSTACILPLKALHSPQRSPDVSTDASQQHTERHPTSPRTTTSLTYMTSHALHSMTSQHTSHAQHMCQPHSLSMSRAKTFNLGLFDTHRASMSGHWFRGIESAESLQSAVIV